MKDLRLCFSLICVLWGFTAMAWPATHMLKDQQVKITIDENENLTSLRNLSTGHNYAGDQSLWQLSFDRNDGEKGIEVHGANTITPYWAVGIKVQKHTGNGQALGSGTRDVLLWGRKMKGWQRIIFVHQYGEKLFRFDGLNERITKVGDSARENTVLAFGWWQNGMDNGYSDSYRVPASAQAAMQHERKSLRTSTKAANDSCSISMTN